MAASGPSVIVVGGGVSGLVSARELSRRGVRVTLLEASARLGGDILTVDVGGTAIDIGAEALYLGPQANRLVDELGLRDDMIVIRGIKSLLYTRRGLRPLPAGVGPAGPTRVLPVIASRTMTLAGLARAGLEPGIAALGAHAPLGLGRSLDLRDGRDVGVGRFTTARFGRQVTEAFVDPLFGGLHSGDVNRLSLRATSPGLIPAAERRESFVLRARKARKGGGGVAQMAFATWREGLTRVVDALVAGTTLAVRTSAPATRIERGEDGAGYRVTLGDGSALGADGIVLAVPASAASRLLATLSPGASASLAATEYASIATVLVGYPKNAVGGLPVDKGTGILVPSALGTVVKAVTFLSSKWPQYADGGTFWVRLSTGRYGDRRAMTLDDDALLTQARADLRSFTGFDGAPSHVRVQRWPNAMPQLTVGHLDRLSTARGALAELSGMALAGASYDGVGLAACLASARAAATAVGDAVTAG